MLCINPSAFGYGEVLFCLDAPTNRPPLQAFACSPLSRYDRPPWGVRPPLQRSARPPLQAFVLRFPASARPPCRRSTSGGVGCGANDRPSASAFGWVALLRFAPLRSLGGVLSPLRSDHVEKENCKRLCLSQFFFQQNTTNPTIYPNFAL